MDQMTTYNYAQAVTAIKQAIQVCRYRMARQINSEMLGLYYSVGKYISLNSRNAQWGSNAIQMISNQLQQELPGLKGFAERNIRRMRQFYEAWVDQFEIHLPLATEFDITPIETDIQPFTFRSPLAAKIDEEDIRCFLAVGFTHHYSILSQAKDVDERWFYIRKCATEFWGKRRYSL